MSYVSELKKVFDDLFKHRERPINQREWSNLVSKTNSLLRSSEGKNVSEKLINVLDSPKNSQVFHSGHPEAIKTAQEKTLNLILATQKPELIEGAVETVLRTPSLYRNQKIVFKAKPFAEKFLHLKKGFYFRLKQLELPLNYKIKKIKGKPKQKKHAVKKSLSKRPKKP